YRGTQAAGDAIRALLQRKLHRGDINVISGAVAIGGLGDVPLETMRLPGFGPVRASGPVQGTLAHGESGLIDALVQIGIPKDDALIYSEGIRRGGTLILASVPEPAADEAADLLDNFGPEDPDELAA